MNPHTDCKTRYMAELKQITPLTLYLILCLVFLAIVSIQIEECEKGNQRACDRISGASST